MIYIICGVNTWFDIKAKKKKPLYKDFFHDYFNETRGIRTPDNLIKSQVLYHLS